MSENLLDQGVALMMYGMGAVFVFLILLIVMTHLMSWTILRFFPDLPTNLGPKQPILGQKGEQTPIAVITAVIHRYRSKHNNKLSP